MGQNMALIGAGTIARTSTRTTTIAILGGSFAVAGVLGMMAFVKFFNFTPEGSMALASALGVGRLAITGIGLVETLAVVLILTPRTRAVGAGLAVLTMLGALTAHATRIGFSGNPAAEMWPLALVVLALASVVLYLSRRASAAATG